MIIRRIIDQLRKQEWGVVVVELLVVVVGIFLGLQVTNWNEDRKAEAEGLYYLDLLRRQLTAEILRDEENISFMTETNMKVGRAAALLYAESWTEEEFQQFKDDHWAVYAALGNLQRPHALKQLVELGKIDLIRSRRLQEMLFEFYVAYEAAIQQDQATVRYASEAVRVIGMGIPYGTRENLMAIPVAPEELLKDREVKSAVRMVTIMNGFQLDALNRLQESRKEMRDELDAFLSENSYSVAKRD